MCWYLLLFISSSVGTKIYGSCCEIKRHFAHWSEGRVDRCMFVLSVDCSIRHRYVRLMIIPKFESNTINKLKLLFPSHTTGNSLDNSWRRYPFSASGKTGVLSEIFRNSPNTSGNIFSFCGGWNTFPPKSYQLLLFYNKFPGSDYFQ